MPRCFQKSCNCPIEFKGVVALSCFSFAHVISRKGDYPRLMSFHVLILLHAAAVFPFVLGRRPPVCSYLMDTILRLLEGLRRDEIVWRNTHLTGRLRAMPPPAAAAATARASAGPVHAFFLARCCLGQVPGGAPFSQRSEQATACTNQMQIRN